MAAKNKTHLNVGLAGFGNIGSGVLRALETNRGLIDGRVPHPIHITRIVDLDTSTKRDAPYDPAILSSDLDGLLNDPDIQVVLELTGTIEAGRALIEKALKNGKHVVTANKALMSIHGMDLIKLAIENKVCVLFEAAVGGGIPLIRTLHQGLSGNNIEAVRGIINGTANYILTQMDEKELDFDTALQQAQELGYAEPDPTFDVEGQDTAHKLAILASLCFGQDVRFEDVTLEGITRVQKPDILFARELGYVIKLLGVARQHQDGIVVYVHPTLLGENTRLGSVSGVYNAVRIDGNLTGSVMLSGRGAGPEPTASAIVSDLMVLASGKAEGGLQREMRLSMATQEKSIQSLDGVKMPYYLRFGLQDKPGALADVLQSLGEQGISVASIKQPTEQEHPENHVHVMVITHEAPYSSLQKALKVIHDLEVNRTRPFVMFMDDMD